jgi:hypothetical protein
MPVFERRDMRALGAIELNMLNLGDGFAEGLDGRRVGEGTPIFDLNGAELFMRCPLGEGSRMYVDIASNPAMGGVVLGVSQGLEWDERQFLELAQGAVGEAIARESDRVRFVAYSFPKIAVQFSAEGKELALVELFTWEPVPPAGPRREGIPGNFERWSFLDDHPGEKSLASRRARFAKRVGELQSLQVIAGDPHLIDRSLLLNLPIPIEPWRRDEWELHYSTRAADHHPCFELRGQETSVWCVGASTQMLLDFYRYEYTQVRLAQELGLGTLTNPNGLSYSAIGQVVTAIEHLTSNALDATMNTAPTWNEFRSELRANRPMISFIPGHSRAVAGYMVSSPFVFSAFRGLLVYDPWPPNVGVITRWENFATQTYFASYRAAVTIVP